MRKGAQWVLFSHAPRDIKFYIGDAKRGGEACQVFIL